MNMNSRIALPGLLAATMTPAERAQGRFMRAPEHDAAPSVKTFLEQHTKAIEDRFGKNDGVLAALREQLAGVEQKMARRPGSEGEGQSFGAQIVKSDRFKSYLADGGRGSARFQLKTTTTASAGTNWSARDPEIAGLAKRRLLIRDLLTVAPTTSGSIDYPHQNVRQNNAAPVAEGAAKPYSNYGWEQLNVPVRTIAHLAKVTRQALDDAVQLQGEIDNEMRYGLGVAEEVELLYGDGTGQHLNGLVPAATGFAAPFVIADATMLDTIGLAILQQALTEYTPDGIVMNPADWMRIRLLKDGQGKYLLGDPGAAVDPVLFGLPVVPTQAMNVDKFMVGGFKLQKLYDRMEPEVLISSENADDFEKNLYTMRCEERVAQIVRVPAALIYGDFGNVG
jgi:HK97 family phage major capsid protein